MSTFSDSYQTPDNSRILLPWLSGIKFAGDHAVDFLHSQLSADIKSLPIGGSQLAAYCDPKGRVLAVLLVQRIKEGCIALMGNELTEQVIQRLRLYVLRADVTIQRLDNHHVYGVPSDQAEIRHVELPFGYSLSTESGDAGQSDYWKAMELSYGLCWLNRESSATWLPQMLGLDNLGALNFNKGCYPGQEIVARTKYLGKIKRIPMVIELAEIIDQALTTGLDLQLHDEEKDYKAQLVDHIATEKQLIFVMAYTNSGINLASITVNGQNVPINYYKIFRSSV